MRRMRQGLGLLAMLALGASGCAERNITLRPPKHPDEIVVPPVADGRFKQPPKYPESVNKNINNDPERMAAGGGGQPNLGAMNMGGMGGGMGGLGGMGGMMGGMGGGYNGRGY